MLQQKPNQHIFPMVTVLIIALVIFSFLLINTVSKLISTPSDEETAAVSVASVHSEPFDYTRDRDQYEVNNVAASQPFDYTRDRDQYCYPAMPFDYTRDRDQYWQHSS
jgi:hypothetical protein